MRASQKAKSHITKTSTGDHNFHEIHISGAEGIFEEKDIAKIVREYTLRAIRHQKGRPDSIVISVEELKQKPLAIQSLPVATLKNRSFLQARSQVRNLLKLCGISKNAVRTSLSVADGTNTMRGASFVLSGSGRRVEQDMSRGIRASRLGIGKAAVKLLSQRLAERGINTATVREALILASKVAACPQVMAELCVSDDPDYTTGYVASKKFGYVRIPHIKKKGEKKGGRVFFLVEDADADSVAGFLEKTPVLINSLAPISGVRTLREIINYIDR